MNLEAQSAVIYARVSSKEQEKEGFSIPAQLKLLDDYSLEHRFSIAHQYVDVETAKQTGRTGFSEMVAFLKSQGKLGNDHACRTILVEKTDRLYRNLKDWVTLDELDIEIHFVKESLILSPNSRSTDKFMHGIKVLMAKNYIDNLSEETRKGMTEKAEQGIWPSCAPVGYINVECGGKRYIQPDPVMAPMVIKLYEWYSSGNYSLLEVTKKIRNEGLAEHKTGAKVQKSLVHKILTNPIYYGDFDWAGKRYRGIHEPLVRKDLWDRVQDVLAYKGNRNTKQQKHEWAFQGLLFCGHCGCAMTAEIKKGKYIYYHCTGQKGKCPEKYVREEEIASQFRDALQAIRFDNDVHEWVVTALKESHRDERRYHDEIISGLQLQCNRLQSRLDTMYVDKLDGRISQETYDEKSRAWKIEQLDILRKMESHQKANHAYIDEGIRILELAKKAVYLYETQEMKERRRLLNFVFSNSIWRDGMLLPNYRKPFDLLVNSRKEAVVKFGGKFDNKAKNENWLPGVDSNHEHPG
ncbi:MAG: recombinase family protein [Armatimonadota bacterium]